jgi:sporulation protein YqfC
MNIFERLDNFIDNKNIELHFINNKVYVFNHDEITDFSSVKITLKHKEGLVNINGKNLVITRLISKELLISGDVINIELR